MENSSNESYGNSTAIKAGSSLPPAALITMGWFALIFVIAGVAGNALTITALTKNRKLRQDASSWFIINLAVSDTLVCLVMMLNYALRYLLGVNLERLICDAYPFIRYALIHVTVLSMLGVTINRYILIIHRTYYDRIYSRRNLVTMTVLIWVIPFLVLCLPAFEIWGRLGYDKERDICMVLPKDGSNPLAYILFFFFGVTCTAIVVSYSIIFYKVRNSRQNLQRLGTQRTGKLREQKQSWGREEMQLTKMIGLILIAYIIGFVPISIVRQLDSNAKASGGKPVHPALYVTALVMGWSIYCTNFFIYAATNEQYRKAYRDLFRSRFTKVKQITAIQPSSSTAKSDLEMDSFQ